MITLFHYGVLPTSQSDDTANYNSLVSKRGSSRDYGEDGLRNSVLRRRNIVSPIYPLDIQVNNQNVVLIMVRFTFHYRMG